MHYPYPTLDSPVYIDETQPDVITIDTLTLTLPDEPQVPEPTVPEPKRVIAEPQVFTPKRFKNLVAPATAVIDLN